MCDGCALGAGRGLDRAETRAAHAGRRPQVGGAGLAAAGQHVDGQGPVLTRLERDRAGEDRPAAEGLAGDLLPLAVDGEPADRPALGGEEVDGGGDGAGPEQRHPPGRDVVRQRGEVLRHRGPQGHRGGELLTVPDARDGPDRDLVVEVVVELVGQRGVQVDPDLRRLRVSAPRGPRRARWGRAAAARRGAPTRPAADAPRRR